MDATQEHEAKTIEGMALFGGVPEPATAAEPMLDGAFRLARSGLKIFPCREIGDNKKAPYTKKGFKDAVADEAQIKQWWGRWPNALIGVPCGEVNGNIELLDFDENAVDLEPWRALVEAEAPGLLKRTVEERSPNGYHIWIRCPEVETPGPQHLIHKLNPVEGGKTCTTETKGKGGYGIIAPSEGYVLVLGDFTDIPAITAAEREVLFRAAAALDEKAAAESVQDVPQELRAKSFDLRPGDDFNGRGDIRPLLESAGWVDVGITTTTSGGATSERWRRPGKPKGWSATIIAGRVLRVFSSNAAPFAAFTSYSPFYVYTLLKHGGDFSAAARQLRAEGYGDQTPMPSRSEVPAQIPEGPAGWPEPVEYNPTSGTPIEENMVTPCLRAFCEAVTEAVQVPYGLSAMNAIGVLSAISQGKYVVEVREGYQESVNIYSMTALPPGERKTPGQDKAKKPVSDWVREKAREMKKEIQQARAARKTRETEIENLRKRAGTKGADETETIIGQINQREEELPEVPVAPRLMLDDATPEAIAHFMSEHDECAAIVESEGGVFERISGLYTKGRPNLNLVLKAHDQTPTPVDRRHGDPILLERPTLTMSLAVQPEVLRDIAGKPGFRGLGLLARFIYCLPKSVLGKRTPEPPAVPRDVEMAYDQMIRRILDAPWAKNEHGEKVPYVIRLSGRAYRAWVDFAEGVEEGLRDGGRFDHIRDWAGKLPGKAARIAALYHIAEEENPAAVELRESTMGQALDLMDALTDHAVVAFSYMDEESGESCGRKILRFIQAERVESFQARDAFERVKGTFRTMERVWPGIQDLEDRGYILRLPEEKREGPGRAPSPTYVVNPKALG